MSTTIIVTSIALAVIFSAAFGIAVWYERRFRPPNDEGEL